MRLNTRLRDIEKRLQTEEDRSARRLSEVAHRKLTQVGKLGVFLVVARADCARGQGEDIGAVEEVLAAMPAGLETVLRSRLADISSQAGINCRREHAAVAPFLPLSAEQERILDDYQAQGFARWRQETKRKPFFNHASEEKQT